MFSLWLFYSWLCTCPCATHKPTSAVCQHPQSVCFVLIATLVPVPLPEVFSGYHSIMASFPPRIMSGMRAATLISVFCLSGQCLIIGKCPGPVWETATPLPSIYPAHNAIELTLVALGTVPDPPPPAAGDFSRSWGFFFPNRNRSGFVRAWSPWLLCPRRH